MQTIDLLLLSASMIDLQTMRDKCGLVGSQRGIAFNSTKSKSIIIGPNVLSKSVNLNINGAPLQWVDKLKYLGIYLCSGSSFIVDLTETRRKFFACLNSIISKCRYSSELVNLKLVESHCLPILSYAMESLNVNISQLKEINSWWNAVYRKLFNYNKWESVKEVICLLERLDFIHIVTLKRLNFVRAMYIGSCKNLIVDHVIKHYMLRSECFALTSKCGVQLEWSVSKIRSAVYNHFASLAVN